MNFSRCLATSLYKGMVVFGLIAAYMIHVWFTPWAQGTDEDVMSIREHAEGSPAYVIEANECVRAGNNLPSGIVFQTADGTAVFSTNPKVIGKGMDEELGGKAWNYGKTNMFCK